MQFKVWKFKQKANNIGKYGNAIVIEGSTMNENNSSSLSSKDGKIRPKRNAHMRGSIPILPGQLSKIQQRNLTLIAKILQKIASDSDVFKEKYMTFCNPCIIKRRKQSYEWYGELCYDGIGNMNIYHILLVFSVLKAFKVFRVFLCLSLFLIKYSQLCFLFPQCKDHL